MLIYRWMVRITKLYCTALSNIFTCLLPLIAIDFHILYNLLTSQANNAILREGERTERKEDRERKRKLKYDLSVY